MSNKKKAFLIDSETDLSSISDNDSNISSIKSINVKTSINETCQSSKINHCLICSILSSLSNVNCCSKHLTLLTKLSSTQIVSIMSPRGSNQSELECHCQSQSKRCHRCRSSSPYIESRKRSTAHRQRLSSSLINSPMNKNNSQKRKRILSLPIVTERNQRKESLVQNESTHQSNNQSTSPDSDTLYSPRISLKRVIHVKDDDEEELIINNPQIIVNMSQATKQMIVQKNTQPKILLKRVCLEQ